MGLQQSGMGTPRTFYNLGPRLNAADFEVPNPPICSCPFCPVRFLNPVVHTPESQPLPCQLRERQRNSDSVGVTRTMCPPLPA